MQVNPEDFPLCGASLMPWLASLPRLQDLSLQGVPKDWAMHASSLTALKTLSVLGYNVNDSAPRRLYSGLSCLHSLTSLQVGCCHVSDEEHGILHVRLRPCWTIICTWEVICFVSDKEARPL